VNDSGRPGIRQRTQTHGFPTGLPIDRFIVDASMTGIRIFEKLIIYL
jgi:hypothetical protein